MLIESATLCQDAQVVGPCEVSNPLCLTALAAKSEDLMPQHLQTTGLCNKDDDTGNKKP